MKKKNGSGSIRKINDSKYECVIQLSYLNKNGHYKRIKRTASSPEAAQKAAQKAVKAFQKENRDILHTINKNSILGYCMDYFIEHLVKENVTGSTYRSYVQSLRNYFYSNEISKMQLHELNQQRFLDYYKYLQQNYSKKTIQTPIQLNRRLCQWLSDLKLIEDNYAKRVQPVFKKEDEISSDKDIVYSKKIFTNEDILKLYYAYDNHLSEYAPIFVLILETMMRGQEILSLCIEDVDFDNNLIYIRSAIAERHIDNNKDNGKEIYIKVPKNGTVRVVTMSNMAREILQNLIFQTKALCKTNEKNLVFPSYQHQGKIRTMDSMEKAFEIICTELNIDRAVHVTKGGRKTGLSIHALRHTAITIANTAPDSNPINTALMAGHKAVTMENIYTHSTIDAVKSVMNVSEGVLGYIPQDSNNQVY